MESIHYDLISSDNDPSTRRDFSIELTTAFQSIFMKFANKDGSGMSVEEALALREGMIEESEKGKAYLRFEFDIVVGRKSA
jgi:hypothetical protein